MNLMSMRSGTRRMAILVATTLFLSGCDEDPASPAPAVTTFTVGAATLPADGEATTVVRAVIPPESRVTPREVTFSTTAGSFSGGQNQHVTVSVGPSGEAVAILKAPTTPGVSLLRAQAGETILLDSIRFTPAPPELQSFVVSSPTAFADGQATVTLRALATPGANNQPRLVTFYSSTGDFLAGSNDTVVVQANNNGEAVAVLKAPNTPGLALVRASSGRTVLQSTIEFSPAPPQIQTVSLSARELPADGASTVTLRALLSTTATNRSVRFGTTAGVLLGTTGRADTAVIIPADPLGVALVLLQADTAPGIALVRATAGPTTLIDSVRLIAARPHQISLAADSFRVVPDPAHPITLTATLSRSPGRVTRGAVVEFSAARPDGTPLGWFGGTTTSNQAGVVTTSYTPGRTTTEGPVIITARTIGANGAMLSESITLEVRGSPPP
jgi:hypothetical protein